MSMANGFLDLLFLNHSNGTVPETIVTMKSYGLIYLDFLFSCLIYLTSHGHFQVVATTYLLTQLALCFSL